MSQLTSGKEFGHARLESFHKRPIAACQTKKGFHRNIRIDLGHVYARTRETVDLLRVTFAAPDRVAAIICGGKINSKRSVIGPTLILAIEAKFTQFVLFDFQRMSETILDCVCVRAIIREEKSKHVVITVYPDHSAEISPDHTPEAQHDIW